MHFLLSALGSAGDVHPFIAVAQSLAARGHATTILASPAFEARIRRTGAGFAPFGQPGDYERLLQRPDLWHARRGARLLLDELLGRLPEAYATTRARATRETVLVGSTLSWGMRLVQETTGLVGATVHLSPLCMPSAIDPPVWPGVGDLRWMPRAGRRVVQRIVDRQLIDRIVTPRLNAMRDGLGLAPVTHVWSRWIHSPDLVVGAWPEWFAQPQADWPPHAITTGFPLFHEGDDGPRDPTLTSFLDGGPAPVGITPGSAMAHGATFLAGALHACQANGRRAVVVTPYRDQLPARLPASVHHVAYAPFSSLLGRLSALIHHGGIGTAAQALAAGIPQVIAPFAHDQFDNAVRLSRVGVATSTAPGARAARWTGALARALDDHVRSAARHHAVRMAEGTPAAERIADALERLGLRANASHGDGTDRPTGRVRPSAATPSA